MNKVPPRWLVRAMMKLGIPMPWPEKEFPENFDAMTPDEKYQFFLDDWMSVENKSFASKKAARAYRRRTQRWADVVALNQPDRVPTLSTSEGFIVDYGGISFKDAFYKNERACKAIVKFYREMQPEFLELVPGGAGNAFDMLAPKIFRWAGSKLPGGLDDHTPYQYVEGEYMSADEYDRFIANPEGYFLRKFLPTAWNGLAGLKSLPSPFYMVGHFGVAFSMMPLAMGPVSKTVSKVIKIARKVGEDSLMRFLVGMEITSKWGVPNLFGGLTLTPFDLIGNMLRGTRGIMLDMYRHPEQLLAACEAVTPATIDMAVQPAVESGLPYVIIPLNKGGDTLMSKEQFLKFYWPSFKMMLEGIIDAGLVPVSLSQGSFNQRLDILAESGLPAGKTAWVFDQTDMKAAKEKIGDFMCIGGNVPTSLFATGTPQKMEAYCKNLIETAGRGGGFFLAPGAEIHNARPENMRAFLSCAKKYGVY